MNSGHAFSPSDSRWAPWRSPFFFSLSPHTSCSTLHGILVPACSHPCSHPSMCWCAWQAMSAAEERTPVYCNKTVVLHLQSVCSVCFQSVSIVFMPVFISNPKHSKFMIYLFLVQLSFTGFETQTARVVHYRFGDTDTDAFVWIWPLAALSGWCLFTF